MNNTAPIETVKTTDTELSAVVSGSHLLSLRVAPNAYFAALLLVSFYAAFTIYLGYSVAGILLLAIGWLFLPPLAWSDRIVFDGRRIWRTGILPGFWARLNGDRRRLKIADIEQIETESIRALKRGGNVFYRYRTIISGKNLKFVLASGGEKYRLIIRGIFERLPENILDNRSLEIKEYLGDPKEILTKAAFAKIPSAEVLENSFEQIFCNKKVASKNLEPDKSLDEINEKAEYLHRLGNELRLSGYLLQGLEALRRALILQPRNAVLLYDFARCLSSYGGSERSAKLKNRANAALRLAEIRAAQSDETNPDFPARLGEAFFQIGDLRRARRIFLRLTGDAATSFRAVRGLAEIALREGKIAHVIHHFAAAANLAETKSLRRWTQNEGEYFERLNGDEEYMEMEISRLNLLETLSATQKTVRRVALFAFPLIFLGILFEESLIANLGWAIAAIALSIWGAITFGRGLFIERIPVDLLDDE